MSYLPCKCITCEPRTEGEHTALLEQHQKPLEALDMKLEIPELRGVSREAFTAEERTKEIGVRKVLGASSANILLLLSREFTKWVIAANLIAWPVAYYAMNRWMQNFAYRTNLGIWPFALAAVLALGIALLTVSAQSIRAALADPIKSLRYE